MKEQCRLQTSTHFRENQMIPHFFIYMRQWRPSGAFAIQHRRCTLDIILASSLIKFGKHFRIPRTNHVNKIYFYLLLYLLDFVFLLYVTPIDGIISK